jgi:two-component system CheB/CheR fusion protein
MKEAADKPQTAQNFPIVGIGASAGGLEAFKKLLKAIPEKSGMAYVIVQHLAPDHDSKLTEILAQSTNLPVHEIVNNINLIPDHIFIIPENHTLITFDGVLKLEERSRNKLKNNSIDIFFESLAEVHKSFAIGVVLSGTAYDGTLGLKKIKEQGGATIAQDPETTIFKSMPQSAIEADAVDFVLAPENIPEQLLKIQNSYAINKGYSEDENLSHNNDGVLKKIVNVIFLRSGNDFRHYKQATLRRRISRRMVSLKKENLEDYYNTLKNDRTEQDLLFNDLLIPVTYFFRDAVFFESLPKTLFPQLMQNAIDNHLRIWVAGCATGEEAYSIAISLHEFLTENNLKEMRVQIFASDISEKCIAKARTAIYSPQDVQQISESRINSYFTKRDGNYHINKVIRDMCVFAVHNFIKDPPFAKIDLVSCRNVLIYFDAYLQNKVLTSFHYSLKEKGYLFLGKSETAANVQNLFEQFGKSEKIYSRKFTPGRYVPEFYKSAGINNRGKIVLNEKKSELKTDFKKIATDILFTKYTPASVIINEHQEIVHFHGDTSLFLQPSPGKPNFNILKMAREGISFELRDALLKAAKSKEAVSKANIAVKNQPYLASFEVLPLDTNDSHSMVLFFKQPLPEIEDTSKLKRKNADQQRIINLENELSLLRDDIKRVTEEQQTAFEELQTTNEELLSSSEELQAMNEELETSTEELQSNNEELMCVNDELMDRQDQLISLRNYAESIIKTIREPLIIVDKDLIIKSANPGFYKYFHTTEHETEGYSFFDIGDCQWNIPEFRELLTKMLNDKISIEDFKVNINCKGIGKKIMMVNARRIIESKPPGMILLALEDITDIVQANVLLTQTNNTLQKYNDQLEQFSSSASHDLQEPLRKVQMFAQRILDNEKEISESSRHNIERILFSCANMSQLISDLIDYSRIGLVEKQFKKTNLNVLMKKTIQDMKDVLADKNAVITITDLPELNVIPFQIQQLFTNLISNAVKYSREGVQPEIKINAQPPTANEIKGITQNSDVDYVKITVQDNGIGFGKEYQNRIFDPFYRLHSHDEYQGSGFGLTLSKKIVENHKGFINASSEVNKGTVINLYLPL